MNLIHSRVFEFVDQYSRLQEPQKFTTTFPNYRDRKLAESALVIRNTVLAFIEGKYKIHLQEHCVRFLPMLFLHYLYTVFVLNIENFAQKNETNIPIINQSE